MRKGLLVAVLFIGLAGIGASDGIRHVAIPTDQALSSLGLRKLWYGSLPMESHRDGLAMLQVFGSDLVAQTVSGKVVALDGEVGAVRWAIRPGSSYAKIRFPLSANAYQYFFLNDLNLYCLDRVSGGVEWTHELAHTPNTFPSADLHRLFVGTSDHRVHGIQLPLPRRMPPPTAESKKFGGMRTEAEESSDLKVPRELWYFSMDQSTHQPPALFEKHVVFADGTGKIFAFQKTKKVLTGTYKTGAAVSAPLAQAGNTVYIASEDHSVYAFDFHAGELSLLWRSTMGGPILRKPMVIGGDLFVTPSQDGLYRLDRNTGLVKWRQPAASRFVAASKRLVVAMDERERLLVLDRERGVVLKSWHAAGYDIVAANDVNDRVYLGSHGGMILALRDIDPAVDLPVDHNPAPAEQANKAKEMKAPDEPPAKPKKDKGSDGAMKDDN
jgi:outer membrane protein assembly factor BamB